MLRKLTIIGLLFVTAVAFVTLFSYTTSPLYPGYGDTADSPIFQIIGKYWAEGLMPYKALWDLKGPYIFAVNALGFKLANDVCGVFCLQILFMACTLFYLYKLFRCHFGTWKSVLGIGLALMSLSYIYEGGNLTEEYLLPFLVSSFYFILRWIDKTEACGECTHPWQAAVIYGMALGLSLMSRLTNALSLCGAVAVIAFVLLSRREYRNLFLNICAFLAGFISTTLPFFIYFHVHHSLAEMWNATFVYALKYAGNPEKDIFSTGVHYFLLSYFSCILMFLVVLLKVIRDRSLNLRSWLWLVSALLPFVWFCQGNGFGHYGMTVFPLFAIALIESSRLGQRALPIVVTLTMVIACGSKLRFMYFMRQWTDRDLIASRALLSHVPDIDYTSFVAYNCSPNIYLALDICPANRFFALQDFAISRNPLLLNEIQQAYIGEPAQWLLVSCSPDSRSYIHNILDDHYLKTAEDTENHLTLYHRRDE